MGVIFHGHNNDHNDGKQVTGERGQTIMEVANANGIDIPHLCYHPSSAKPVHAGCAL